MKRNALKQTLLMGMGSVLLAGTSHAAIVNTIETASQFGGLSGTDANGNLLVTGDLLTTATTTENALFTSDALFEGAVQPVDADVNDAEVSTIFGTGAVDFLQYDFAGPVDIGEIVIYSGWNGGRAGQAFDIQVSTNGGTTFTSLYNYSESVGGTLAVQVNIFDDASATLAAGVTNIRFDFPGTSNSTVPGSGSVVREIDVIAVPEPGSLALLGLGGLLVASRRRH